MKIALAALIIGLVGCTSHPRFYGGGFTPPSPHVEMSILGTDEEVDRQPIVKTPAQAVIFFPLALRHASIGGEVLATATVEVDGRVSNVVIDRASQPDFVAPVVSGLRKCSFFPATRGGAAVATRVRCKIQFLFTEE
jgi:TonB family protein